MHKTEIVRADRGHLSLLASLGRTTFGDTFIGMAYYTKEMIDDYTSKAFSEQTLAPDFDDPRVAYLLLKVEGEWAGYAKVLAREPAACIASLPAICLERLYLERSFQRGGYGSLLLNAAFDEGRARGFRHLWLGVCEYNTPAIAFYQKHGFARAGVWEWVFESQGVRYVDQDWVMTIEIPN